MQLAIAALWRQNLDAGKAFEVLTVEGADSFDSIRHHRCDKLQIKQDVGIDRGSVKGHRRTGPRGEGHSGHGRATRAGA
jgi:hypothetical protein